MTRFPDVARTFAISRAASRRRSSRKPLFARIASPISSALRASPCARTIIDYWESVSPELMVKSVATRLFFLYGLVNQKRGSECCLLCNLGRYIVIRHNFGRLPEETNLFCLDGMCEFRGERDVSDGDIVQHNVELQSSSCEILADQSRDLTGHS